MIGSERTINILLNIHKVKYFRSRSKIVKWPKGGYSLDPFIWGSSGGQCRTELKNNDCPWTHKKISRLRTHVAV